ncbi:MAG TPA: hypothetical protein PL151_12110 [Phycisphaerae bacterium]|nr:hypothetical protein [Phycisphaerae bacterium]HOJ73514.1 hypothetical protein [Phycisphaerae bacterium]HOM51678.1 hypothetical protein [Phycisphaerae bacterium]HON68330.1 hypothetical protein [Phycisphaerae bacterium]HOQ86275.1 hypothetical protein [Phycisphaerae bacterium]
MSTLFPRKKRSTALEILTCITVGVLAGLSGCFNPAFVNQLAGGSVVPIAPGDTPFIHVLVINATQNSTVGMQFGWTPLTQGRNTAEYTGIAPEQQIGFLLPCPVEQIGLGNPNDLTQPAVVVTTEGGAVSIPASAFPLILQRGRDFDCGDTVVFTVIDSRSNGYGVEILPGRVRGSGQTGPFSGPDTYEIVELLLLGTGLPPTPVP